MLDAVGVRKSYGDVPALKGVDLAVSAGQIVGVVGPNGAGKSTLLHLIAGLRRPDAGSIRICGVDVGRGKEATAHLLGMVFQEVGVYPVLTVGQNLSFFAALWGLRGHARRTRLEVVTDALALGPLCDREARHLSGGERKRLHIAAALLHRPPLLLLDEPTAGVDVATRAQILELVRAEASRGAGICYCTHYLEEVERLDAHVAMLHGGEIVAKGTLTEIVTDQPSLLEFVFDGSPPAVFRGLGAEYSGSAVRLTTAEPFRALAELIRTMGGDSERIVTTKVIRPTLETAFRRITGVSARTDEAP